MSTEWGYKCLTCDRKLEDTWFNHGQGKLIEALHLWPIIKQIQASVWLRVSFDPDWYSFEVFSFLAQHEGHDIAFLNEYGDIETISPP